jgi:hypothetical protein
MNIVLWTDDLMSRVRIESRWKKAGATIMKRSDEGSADLIVMDLQANEAMHHIMRLRTSRPDLYLIAYGPHVDGSALKTAREAGANEVVARGKVVERVLRRFEQH